MTGFARTQGDECGISWVWELKSVNGKSLDLRLRLAPGFDLLEPQLRAAVAQRFRRGNFSAALVVTRTAPAGLRVNRDALAQLVSLMNELAGELDAAPPRLDGLLALRGVVETIEDDEDAVIERLLDQMLPPVDSIHDLQRPSRTWLFAERSQKVHELFGFFG